MKYSNNGLSVLVLVSAMLVGGCGGGGSVVGSGGESGESGESSDAPVNQGTVVPTTVGDTTTLDGVTNIDVPTDIGNLNNPGEVTETGTITETITETETGTVTDTGTLTDTGTVTDTGTLTDTGTVTDNLLNASQAPELGKLVGPISFTYAFTGEMSSFKIDSQFTDSDIRLDASGSSFLISGIVESSVREAASTAFSVPLRIPMACSEITSRSEILCTMLFENGDSLVLVFGYLANGASNGIFELCMAGTTVVDCIADLNGTPDGPLMVGPTSIADIALRSHIANDYDSAGIVDYMRYAEQASNTISTKQGNYADTSEESILSTIQPIVSMHEQHITRLKNWIN